MTEYRHCERCAYAFATRESFGCPRCSRSTSSTLENGEPPVASVPKNAHAEPMKATVVYSERPVEPTDVPRGARLGAVDRVTSATAELLSALADATPVELARIATSGLAPTVEDDPWAAVILHAIVTAAKQRQGATSVETTAAATFASAHAPWPHASTTVVSDARSNPHTTGSMDDRSVRAFLLGFVVGAATKAQEAWMLARHVARAPLYRM